MYENVGLTSLDYIEEILHLRKALADVSDECSKAYDKIANFEQQRWISVKDEMPPKDETVLAWNKDGFPMIDVWRGKTWNYAWTVDEISHWMPIPEKPESEE